MKYFTLTILLDERSLGEVGGTFMLTFIPSCRCALQPSAFCLVTKITSAL